MNDPLTIIAVVGSVAVCLSASPDVLCTPE